LPFLKINSTSRVNFKTAGFLNRSCDAAKYTFGHADILERDLLQADSAACSKNNENKIMSVRIVPINPAKIQRGTP